MRKSSVGVAAVVAILILLAWAVTGFPLGAKKAPTTTVSTTTTTVTLSRVGGGADILGIETHGGSPSNWLADSPEFQGNALRIDYPPDYSALANFTLGVINSDRASSGLDPVGLSSVPSGQQHADSMAYYAYFSHWDNQGYKPYMRYTLLGGEGNVVENLALDYCRSPATNLTHAGPAPCSTQTVENAINASEWEMMNNDSQCCSDGHRVNILGPFHNLVSLGIAYNSTTVFLVEDFENSYISSESLQVNGSNVTFSGVLPKVQYDWMSRQTGAEITVYYDGTPTGIPLSSLNQLNKCSGYNELNESSACRYQGAYDPGTEISAVFEPCPTAETCSSGNYTYAQAWVYTQSSGVFDVEFSLGALEAAHGSGVYTLYLWPSERAPEPITSLSIFVGGS
jgi:uncharacterized protein YkwD